MMGPRVISTILAVALLPGAAWASRQTEDARLHMELKPLTPERGNPEPAAVAESGGRARRQGNVLSLKISGRARLRLKSESGACVDDDSCVEYRLVADLPSRHAYLVDKRYPEGGDSILIDDRTGRRTILPGTPLFSPDSQELIAVDNGCLVNGCDHDIEIWKRSGDHFVVEWGRPPDSIKEYPTIDLDRWDQPNRVTASYSTQGFYPPAARWEVVMLREHGRWRMDEKIPSHLLEESAPKAN
jgi:hypothetical protein